MDSADIAMGGKIVGAAGASMVAIAKFLSRFQTKGNCKKAHTEHDKLDIERQKLRDEKLGRIHDSVDRIEKLVSKIANDFYEPRGNQSTRRGDPG